MVKVVVINASPRKDQGNTGMILSPFVEGLKDNGAEVDLFYASKLNVKPCSCGQLSCWYRTPGECIYKDSMTTLYYALKKAQVLVFASPIYSPLPGDLQNIINRMVALLDPKLEFREGRTRARFREDVNIKKIVLIAAGGWWEKANVNLLQHVIKELAENAGVQFTGILFRPHAYAMQTPDGTMPDGERVLSAMRRAGCELMENGEFSQNTEDAVSEMLLPREMYEKYLGQ